MVPDKYNLFGVHQIHQPLGGICVQAVIERRIMINEEVYLNGSPRQNILVASSFNLVDAFCQYPNSEPGGD
jgi:hypothetical protein